MDNKEYAIEFSVWLSRYYYQTEQWRYWRNPNNNKTYDVEELHAFYEKNVYGKSVTINNYPVV